MSPLLFQEAVAGASILGAMTAGSVNLPQLPQAVMAAQAPGVITGKPGFQDFPGMTHGRSLIMLLALSQSVSYIQPAFLCMMSQHATYVVSVCVIVVLQLFSCKVGIF